MKALKKLKLAVLTIVLLIPAIGFNQSDIELKLREIPSVKKVNRMETVSHFEENYELWFEQLTDPKNPKSEKFLQRVLLGHVKSKKPVVVELQGYEIYSEKSGELAKMFKCNQITIEHRYFDQSKPESGIPWRTLTIDNAAHDQHLIINAIKEAIYPTSKFISTGISKGGQTTMIHRSKFPDDVDVSVCYVAPLNFEREDERIYHFLDTVGTVQQRKQVEAFQLLCLQRRESLLPILDSLADVKNWKWKFDINKAFEYYVLEYSFAFWQWGGIDFANIPAKEASDQVILSHLLQTSGVSFFENKGVQKLQPFFYAALTEMGMYGYEYEPFQEYLSEQKEYTFDFTFPEGFSAPFSDSSMRAVNNFIQKDGDQMMFIYGGKDTWSATAVQLSDEAKNRGLKKYVYAEGHHGTRIRSFPKKRQKEIRKTIKRWLKSK